MLPGSLKSAFVPFFAGIPQRTGFRGEMRYGLLNDLRPLDTFALPMTVERFAALAAPVGTPLPEPLPRPQLVAQADNQARLRAAHALPADIPAVAFMPGAEKADDAPAASGAAGAETSDELAKLREQMADIQRKLESLGR